MKIKQAAAVAIFLAAAFGRVDAQEYDRPPIEIGSKKTRAEVIAELKKAHENGELAVPDHNYPHVEIGSKKTRAEVIAELKKAHENSELVVPDHNYPLANQ